MAFRQTPLIMCLALTLLGTGGAAHAQDAAAGERLFRARCASCHAVESGQNRIGPSLSGVIGRKAGSLEGARYSQGMRALDVTWDAAQLDTYLANPRAMVPGTTMTVSVTSAADRAAITGYLQTLSQPK
ncbi:MULTISPECIES: c-type cytochrome [Azorhizobium]|uniref:Putative c-type cytochrome n=1 Tax=Azorhizobium caulinodans (strain ATCC 43989 / DSM 5975 / JCM 20966 / LMG 6465 / NBRC 14845 / NCIMB 13405 / ORS 571) TaxID=438753 RepID=A8IHH4_AZOC5|nr:MULTISPECIES: c-type cytochrome [Azorhizobium]TDT93733.1 cytochrome c [Azorhizobium sp. AG788]BAF89274.1 putative c-type cytochrome [Azorhizobium caulinodans ORS 571]